MKKNVEKTTAPAGFTLLELIIVVTIMTIIASAAALAFRSSLRLSQLQGAADRLISDLYLVRDKAVLVQQERTLQIDTNYNQYCAPMVAELSSSEDISVCLAGPPFQVESIACRLQGKNQVTFDAHGRASPSGYIDLSAGRHKITIKIEDGGHVEQVK